MGHCSPRRRTASFSGDCAPPRRRGCGAQCIQKKRKRNQAASIYIETAKYCSKPPLPKSLQPHDVRMHRRKSLALCRIAHGPLSDDGPALSTTGRTGRSGVALQRPRCKTAFFVISFALGSSTLTKEAPFTSCGFFESTSSKVSRCGSRSVDPAPLGS